MGLDDRHVVDRHVDDRHVDEVSFGIASRENSGHGLLLLTFISYSRIAKENNLQGIYSSFRYEYCAVTTAILKVK
jgi:hypothetical protein